MRKDSIERKNTYRTYCSGNWPNRYLFKASVHMLVVLSVLFCMCGYDVIEVSQSSKMAVLAGSAVGGAKLCT